MTTIPVVVGNAGRTSRQEISVGLWTLERDARFEVRVVLDDADTKLTAARERPHPRRSGHVPRLQTNARISSRLSHKSAAARSGPFRGD